MAKKEGKKRGRPSDYTPELGEKICEVISKSEHGLRKICEEHNEFPSDKTVYAWLDAHEDFRKQYAHAREAQQEYIEDKMLEIADNGSNDSNIDENGKVYVDNEVIQRSKLRIDVRKFRLKILNPKKYGDKVTQEVSGPDGKPIETKNENSSTLKITSVDERIKDILGK